MDKNKLSSTLKRALKGKKLSTVAREAGIPKSLLHDWTVAGRLPSGKNISHLKKLVVFLGFNSIDEVLFGENERTVILTTRFKDAENEFQISVEKVRK